MLDDFLDILPNVLTALVIMVAVPLNWYVTALLYRLHRADPQGAAVVVMGVLSTCVALTVTVFALVFINNGMDEPVLTNYQTMVLTRSAILFLFIVAPLMFLRWYRRKNGH